MMKFNIKHIICGLVGSLLLCSNANATSTSITANVAFETAITLTVNNAINFGEVVGSTAASYTIDTAGVVTTSSPGIIIGGTTAAGQITIVGDATATIAISTSGYTADHGVTPSAAMCKYNGGTPTACDGAGLTGQAAPTSGGKVLLLGCTIAADGTSANAPDTTAAPSFTVTVIYG